MLDKIFSRDKFHLLDGAMGTMLQKAGLKLGQVPETLSITNPETITEIHSQYVLAGSEIIYANTFGANALKLAKTPYTVEEIVTASITNAKKAANNKALVALDIGPLGELIEPHGTLTFDRAYDLFKEIIVAGVKARADLVVFETFTDLYELKAGILATKENSDLPIFCSMSFEENGRTFTGCDVVSFGQTAVGLGANAVGINCSLGPKEILPLFEKLAKSTPENFPLFVKPNRGLPCADGSGYSLNADEFCEFIDLYRDLGVLFVGGCCGTTPEFIEKTAKLLVNKKPSFKPANKHGYICSPTKAVEISGVTVVGERINPTGKKRFQQALKESDFDYVLGQAVEQANAGADLLDVNVGIPEIDETVVLCQTMKNIQSILDQPLQLDSSNHLALEKALRYYSGKPIVNSVNGEESSLNSILPLCKKYGSAVIGLTLDKNGIPETSEGRFEIAKKIVSACEKFGIDRKDIYIDCLTMTVSANQNNAKVTLNAMKMVKEKLGVKTALGVSNVSFGLPVRNNVNSCFLTLAMNNGLDLAIINPNAEEMMSQVFAFKALTGQDENCSNYVARYKNATLSTTFSAGTQTKVTNSESLKDCVIKGLKGKAATLAKELLKNKDALEIVDGELIPALDEVGNSFEKGQAYLPELLASASACQSAFEVIKTHLINNGKQEEFKGKVMLATVKGDVHDIGKNIVKVVLENYGYQVIDLGRDVPPENVVKSLKEFDCNVLGLSALMTTTLKSMEETINLVKKENPNCKIIVGGAVLTEDYALKIGADFYAKDAKVATDVVKKIFNF